MKRRFELGLLTRAVCFAAGAALLSAAVDVRAQDRAPGAPPAQAAPQQPAQPDKPNPPPAPEQKQGVFETFGRWFDESAINMRRGFDDAWKGMGTVGNTAGDAAKGTADVMVKGTADAMQGTADAFGKIGSSRFVNGRERCAIAPNGAPDCKTAAVTMCKAGGYQTGDSVDYVTAEACPTTAYLNGRKPPTGECPIEHTVTRALCQ
jgi:hypothetical protein